MSEQNELDFTCGVSDEELTKRFEEAVRIENEIKKIKGLPIAKCDFDKKLPIWNILMGRKSMLKKPEIIVFAGPNGSKKAPIQVVAL